MVDSTPPPEGTAGTREARHRHFPLWSSLVLIASGVILIVLETPTLFLFLGIAFVALGFYGLVARRSPS